MNFYDHHIGDYDAATAHLSWDEDMAYTRLMRVYYRTEKPIPVDMAAACRLVRVTSPKHRQAVKSVLDEFFQLRDDGWHNKRCDEEIAKARDSTEDNRDRRENERERQRRHRQHRKELFAALRTFGEIPKWDTPSEELEAILSRFQQRDGHAPVTRDSTDQSRTCTEMSQAPETDLQRLTSSQLPVPTSQSNNIPPPAGGEPRPGEDPDRMIWQIGVKLLAESGRDETAARKILGRHFKVDKAKLAQVIADMAISKPIDPVAYLERSMRPPERRAVV